MLKRPNFNVVFTKTAPHAAPPPPFRGYTGRILPTTYRVEKLRESGKERYSIVPAFTNRAKKTGEV